MTGYPEFNHPAFLEGAKKLRELGHEVFCPAEHDLKWGFRPTGLKGTVEEMESSGFSLRDALWADLNWLTQMANAVVVLPGWGKSPGAVAEVATAQALSLPVWELCDFLEFGPHPEVSVGLVIHWVW